jgi:hypothetical protein
VKSYAATSSYRYNILGGNMSIYEDGISAAKALNDYTTKYGNIIRDVRALCVETLRMASADRSQHPGDRDEKLLGQELMAYKLLDILELEVDHYFCGNPILKEKRL